MLAICTGSRDGSAIDCGKRRAFRAALHEATLRAIQSRTSLAMKSAALSLQESKWHEATTLAHCQG